MSRTLKIVFGVGFFLGGLIWAGKGVSLIVDPNFKLDRFEMVISSFATAWWLMEYLFRITKDD